MARYLRRSRWFWVRWSLFVASAGIAVAVCLILQHLDEIVHQKTLTIAREKFENADVFIRSTHVLEGEGIELSRFILLAHSDANSVARTDAEHDANSTETGPEADQTSSKNATEHDEADSPEETNNSYPAVLEADRVLLECPTHLTELNSNMAIRKITLDGATIRTFRRPDGSWSLAALKTKPESSSVSSHATIQLRNTVLELHDMMDAQTERKLILRNVSMTITPEFQQEEDPNASAFQFVGHADCEFSRNIEFSGRFYPTSGKVEVDADIEALHFSEQFVQKLPLEIASKMDALRPLVGLVTTQVRVRTQLDDFANTQFFLKGRLSRGKAEDARLPQAMSEISTDFQIGNGGILVPNLTLKYGAGTVALSMTQWGYGTNAPREIQTNIRNVNLVEIAKLNSSSKVQDFLNQIQAAGQIDMDGKFRFDGTCWQATGNVNCRNMSLLYAQFPYRIENLNGQIALGGDSVAFQFQTPQGDITLNGQVPITSPQQPQAKQQGMLNIEARRLPVDERLLTACPAKVETLLRSLEIGGAVNAKISQTFTMGAPASRDSHLRIELLKNTIRYRNFPYPVRDIEGTIDIHNGQIVAQNLHGTNNQAGVTISCTAQLPPPNTGQTHGTPPAFQEPRLELFITGTNIFLDKEFYNHLPPNMGSLSQYIQPQGAVQIQYHYKKDPAIPPQVELSVATSADGIVLELPAVSYHFEHFQGQIHYANGQFLLPQFQAQHGESRVSGRLSGRVLSPQQWQCQLENLCVDGVPLNQEFLSFLPSKLRVTIASKRPEGVLYYHGAFNLRCDSTSATAPVTAAWKGELGLTQAAFDCGARLTNINGGVQIQGSWDGHSLVNTGELQLDSLFCKNVQFTNLHGPLWIDNTQILLGDVAQRRIQQHQAQTQNQAAQTAGATASANPNPATASTAATSTAASPTATPATETPASTQAPPAGVVSSSTVQNPLCASTLDGDLLVNLALHFGDPATFYVTTILTKAKLEAASAITGNDQLKGDVTLTLKLQGNDTSMYSLKGNGELYLDNANIYKLSTMMSLLKILSMKEVDQNGFSSGTARFHIDGQHVYFDQLDFYGDAFSLFGKGELNFKQQVQLVFYSTPGRGKQGIPIVNQLVHATGRQMMYITMRGSLRSPEIRKQPLPGLNMALQQMEEDFLAPSTASPSVGSQAAPPANTPGRR